MPDKSRSKMMKADKSIFDSRFAEIFTQKTRLFKDNNIEWQLISSRQLNSVAKFD